MKGIEYSKGYKYQLRKRYCVFVGIRPAADIRTEFIMLDSSGLLSVQSGYAWDGPSGPAIDTKNFMRGSLVHDALYQLIREKQLDPDIHRAQADSILKKICLEDGMCAIRAWWVYLAVRYAAAPAANPANDKPILTAP